jgi:hypothetical protein
VWGAKILITQAELADLQAKRNFGTHKVTRPLYLPPRGSTAATDSADSSTSITEPRREPNRNFETFTVVFGSAWSRSPGSPRPDQADLQGKRCGAC